MSIWQVMYRTSITALVVVALSALVWLFYPKFQELTSLGQRRANLEAQIRAEEEFLQELRIKQERLRNDPRFVERIAREELGYAKPGEVVFRFEDGPAPTNQQPR